MHLFGVGWKNREEISIFLFWEGKRIGNLGQIIFPLLTIYQIKLEIAHSAEGRVKLAVINFLVSWFLMLVMVSFKKIA